MSLVQTPPGGHAVGGRILAEKSPVGAPLMRYTFSGELRLMVTSTEVPASTTALGQEVIAAVAGADTATAAQSTTNTLSIAITARRGRKADM